MKKILLGFLVLGAVSFAQIKSNTNALSQAQTTLSSTQENRGQTNSDPQPEMVHQSPFDAVKGLKEDLSKRDAFSKHYINEDGSFTALIGAGPIHYEKNGQFLDIDHTITQSSTMNFPFANTTNLMESYFGATVEYGVKSKTAEGEVKEFLNTSMYWEVNGQAVGKINSANVPVSVQGDKAYYHNIYGNIAAEFAVLTGKRELNYIINSKQDLGEIPANADYLVFSEDVVLPFGWTSTITDSGVMIKDAMGQEIYLYENPHSTDAESHALREENTIFETSQIGNTLTIKTKVKTEWLLSNERVFPVMVDPTANAIANGGRSVYNDGYEDTLGYFGAVSGFELRYHVKFNTTSIPAGSTVNSATGYIYIYGHGGDYTYNSPAEAYIFKNSNDPTTTNGTTLFNSATNILSTRSPDLGWGWQYESATFTNEGITYIQNNYQSNAVSLAVVPDGNYEWSDFFAARTHNDTANKPYLSITYTVPVNCDPITATASKQIICPEEEVTLSVSSTGTGYTYKWYDNWDESNLTGNLIGTGNSIVVNPAKTTIYQVTAEKANCNWQNVRNNVTVVVTPTPTLITLSPTEAIACSSDAVKIEITEGGIIDPIILTENFDDLVGIKFTTEVMNVSPAPGTNEYNGAWTQYESDDDISSPDNSAFAIVGAAVFFDAPHSLESALVSPPINLADYSAPITMTFNHVFDKQSISQAYVEISSDGGANWSQLKFYNTSVGAWKAFAPETINLNAYAGKEFVLIRFRYVSDNDMLWAIDDIHIEGNSNPTTITWSPFAGLFMDEAKTIAYNGQNTPTVYASPNVTTTYTASAKTAVGCPAETTVTIEKGDKIWMGNNTDWLAETNWSEDSVPTADHCVKIPETSIKPVISAGEQFAKSLEVETGGGLIINENSSLTVTNQIVNNASATDFVIKDGANLVQINDDAVNVGEITVERDFNFSAERKQYNFIISPVEGQTIKTIYPGNPRVIEYVEGQNWFVEAGLGVYVPGKGYSIREVAGPGVETVTATLKGKPANGVIAFTLKYDSHPNQQEGADDKGYNLVGNPYPSSLDLEQLYAANATNMEPTFQFWDNRGNTQYIQNGSEYNGANYAQYNALNSTGVTAGGKAATGATGDVRLPNHLARVGTAFMIRALEVGKDKDLVFKNEYRSASNENSPEFFGKNNEINLQKDRYWLTLTTPTNISLMNAVVYFENGNDAYSMDDSDSNGSSDDLYTLVDEHQIAIQGKSSFVVNDTIVLGYRAFETGEHRIDIFDQEGVFANGQNIYLIDRDLDIIHNLSEGTYTFRTEAGEFNDRFTIVYEEDEVLSTIDFANGDIQVYRQDKITVIRSLKQDLRELKIFNLNGQLLLHEEQLSGKYYHLPEGRLGKQVLLLNAKTADGKVHSFKILTH